MNMKQTIEIDNDLIRIADISAIRLNQSVITIILKNGVSLVNDIISIDDYEKDKAEYLTDSELTHQYHKHRDERILELKEKIHEIESAININND